MYKIDGKVVTTDEISNMLRKYDNRSFVLFMEGKKVVKKSSKRRLVTLIPIVVQIPFIFGNPFQNGAIVFALSIYGLNEESNVRQGRKKMKNAIDLYNEKRINNTLNPQNSLFNSNKIH